MTEQQHVAGSMLDHHHTIHTRAGEWMCKDTLYYEFRRSWLNFYTYCLFTSRSSWIHCSCYQTLNLFTHKHMRFVICEAPIQKLLLIWHPHFCTVAKPDTWYWITKNSLCFYVIPNHMCNSSALESIKKHSARLELMLSAFPQLSTFLDRLIRDEDHKTSTSHYIKKRKQKKPFHTQSSF